MAVTNDLTLIHACDAVTDATTSHVLSSTGGGAIKTVAADEISPRQGTGCYGVDLDIETLYFQIAHASTSWNLTNCAIYAWFAFYTSTYLDTWQNGGVTCRLLDTSGNYSEWYLGGSDSVGSAWQRLCFSTSTTPDAVSGTLSISAVTQIRFYFTGTQKSKLAENVLMDFVHYGADGTGITITGGTSGTPETLDDIVGDDYTAAIGLIEKFNGVYFLNGPITFGDSGGTSDLYFKDTNKIISTVGRYRSFTTTNRTSAETLLSSSHYDINIEGNSTGTNSFIMGVASGTSGYNGCIISSGGDIAPVFTVGASNVDAFEIYGCSFLGLGDVTFANDSSHKCYQNSFSGCGQIIPTGAIAIRNCNFINTADVDAALLWNNSIDIQSCNFLANTVGAAIEHTNIDNSPFNYTALLFSGNTYDTLNVENQTAVTAGSFVVGDGYKIVTVGTTDFTAIGAASNTVGVKFIATGVGSGTGTATECLVVNKLSGSNPTTSESAGTNSDFIYAATYSHVLTGLEQNTEITYVSAGTSTELFHVENASVSDGDGKYKTTYSHSGGASVDILIHHKSYEPDINNIYGLTLPETDASVKISMFLDGNYENPT